VICILPATFWVRFSKVVLEILVTNYYYYYYYLINWVLVCPTYTIWDCFWIWYSKYTVTERDRQPYVLLYIYLFMAQGPLVGQSLLIAEASRSQTQCTRQDCSGRVISPSQRSLSETTYNIHKRQTSMPPAGFEPAIPASERSQTHDLDLPDTGIDFACAFLHVYVCVCVCVCVCREREERRGRMKNHDKY